MITYTISATKQSVYDEVAKTTAYTGDKMTGDEHAYDRIFTRQADHDMLSRFWDEAAATITESLKRFIADTADTTTDGSDGYTATLQLSDRSDTALLPSVQQSLFSFFVNAIISKWNALANKPEVERYEQEANAAITDMLSKLYYKTRPTRVSPK